MYIYYINTPKLCFAIAVLGREWKQGRFRGSNEGAGESNRGAQGSNRGALREQK